jgi:para-nitrobenzyl esterase
VSPPRVVTAAGPVEGDTVSAPDGTPVRRFLGIPYAGAPTGAGRWRRPPATTPWTGVRAARDFGPAAPQTRGLPSVLPAFQPDATSEDCLTLNVWTPALDGHRPVMVWIHGGAFTSGGASQPVSDGARLAAEGDVVVVTLNYRLGVLGFLCPDDASPGADVVANAGLHDQLAALAWVREHAGVLGGDAESLTAFGESAGAGSILHLLTANAAGAAFDRAIAQSGEPRTLSREDAARVAASIATAVGVERADTTHLGAVPLDALLAAQDRVAMELLGTIGVMPYAPTVDGALLPAPVLDATTAGAGADVALLLGTTRDELRLFPDATAATLDDDRLHRRVHRLVPGCDPAATVAAYRAGLGDKSTNGEVWETVRTDALMWVPNLRLAEARAAVGATTYLYRFEWPAPGVGAAHAVDLPFTFGTFDREGWGAAVGADSAAEALGARLRQSWATFARTGNPGGATGSPWPAYELSRRATRLFARVDHVVDDPDGERRVQYD